MVTNQEIKDADTPAEAAALWWVSALRDPKHDNGSGNPMLLALAASAKRANPQPPMEVLEQFRANLVEQLNACFDGSNGYVGSQGVNLSVDYHPGRILSECADNAGFQGGIVNWPWKTTMWVKPDEVSVSYGYNSELEVIWTKKS